MQRRTMIGALLVALIGSTVQAASSPMPEFTIYHLEGRRSERIVWLMEELGLPYKLEFKRGDLAGIDGSDPRASARSCRWRRP